MVAHVPRMNAQESEAWLGLVALLELLPASLDAQLQRDSDLTHFEFTLLTQLRFAPEQTLQSKDLAGATNATLPRLSHVVRRLVERGLVERLPCPEDKRATNVRLTAAGRSAVIKATAGHIAHVRALVMDQLDDADLAALASITRAVNANLDPTDRLTRALRGPAD